MSGSGPEVQTGGTNPGCALVALLSIALGVFCAVVAWLGPSGMHFNGGWPGLQWSWSSGHVTVVGTVVGRKFEAWGYARSHSYPIVRYQVGERAFEIKGLGGSGFDYEVGDHVRVAYDSGMPESGRVIGFKQQYLPPLAILSVGFVLLVLGALGFKMGVWTTAPSDARGAA